MEPRKNGKRNKGIKEQRNKETKEQRNKGTKEGTKTEYARNVGS